MVSGRDDPAAGSAAVDDPAAGGAADDEARIAAVRRYDVLDTPPDRAFDAITAIAARLLDVPVAVVSIVDENRIWLKSRHGIDLREIGRDAGLAAALLQHEPWVVTDAETDARVLANPLMAGEAGFRFYAGVPLTTSDGTSMRINAQTGTCRFSDTSATRSGRIRSNAAAKITLVEDRKSVPVQSSHQAPNAKTMIAWMMWLSMRYAARSPGKPQMGTAGASGT